MTYVYLLQSIPGPQSRYVGKTANLKLRLADHNAGRSDHTSEDRPWRISTYHAFVDDRRARGSRTQQFILVARQVRRECH